ncbi:GNAT family N-acetyltransferase [Aureimonas altamirensis]|uniref:GNAT family N-acetyltransferase n=1 Tax=Aureimonas altamirensis TaxID=370622 RepID=UPI002554186E|nr:GNAT family N-acetyltransferase [Aureimonas altamirensis]
MSDMTMNQARWRAMTDHDVAAVTALADRVHPGLPERPEVFANRIGLFADGAIVLDTGEAIVGYGVAHPIERLSPPPLDTILDGLEPAADAFYIHDLVVAPERRGRGEARQGIERLLAIAARLPVTTLISVYGTGPFWARFGFTAIDDAALAAKLAAYGPDAIYMQRDNRL